MLHIQPFRQALFFLLIAVNAIAVLIGLAYYQEQLELTPPMMLLFVPDCPIFVFLTLFIMLGLVKSKPFSFFVSCGMVKYGLWTIFVMLFHFQTYLLSDILVTSLIFIIGHILMVFEGFAILPKKNAGSAVLAATMFLLLLNDYFDYSSGTKPFIPNGGIEIVAVFTIMASIAIPLLLWKNAAKLSGLPLARHLSAIIRI